MSARREIFDEMRAQSRWSEQYDFREVVLFFPSRMSKNIKRRRKEIIEANPDNHSLFLAEVRAK